MKGRITGVNIASFLQMLQMEQRTCKLTIQAEDGEGVLYVQKGDLVDAQFRDWDVEASIYELVLWEDAEVLVELYQATSSPRIHLSLNHVLMEAARLRDEESVEALGAYVDSGEDLLPEGDISLEELERMFMTGDARQQDELAQDEDRPAAEDRQQVNSSSQKENMMDNVEEILAQAMQIAGAEGVALVAVDSGMALGTKGGGTLDLEVAAAGNTEVVRSKMRVMKELGLAGEKIEDILITLSHQYHLINPLGNDQTLFLYLVLNKEQSNLAMARHKLHGLEKQVQV